MKSMKRAATKKGYDLSVPASPHIEKDIRKDAKIPMPPNVGTIFSWRFRPLSGISVNLFKEAILIIAGIAIKLTVIAVINAGRSLRIRIL
jgi:hypothetical protein